MTLLKRIFSTPDQALTMPSNVRRAAYRSIQQAPVTTATAKMPTKPIRQTPSEAWRKFFQRES